MLKKFVLSLMALLVGVAIAIFGVFLSVFADGNLSERLMLIATVLLVYFVLTLVFTYIQPDKAWFNAAFLNISGIIALILNYENIYYVLYIFSILVLSFFGVIAGRRLSLRYAKK